MCKKYNSRKYNINMKKRIIYVKIEICKVYVSIYMNIKERKKLDGIIKLI